MIRHQQCWRGRFLLAICGVWLVAPSIAAQQLVVGAGASFTMGSSVIDAGCRDISVMGTLDIGAGTLQGARNLAVPGTLRGGTGLIQLSGDLDAAGNLVPQAGTVRISDGCGSTQSNVIGNHQFNRLTVQTSAPHDLILPAGGTQLIASGLELLGGLQRLILRSSNLGVVSFLSLAAGGSQTIGSVDAIDVGAPPNAQFLAPNKPETYNSIDRGNTPRFFADEPVVPVPTLSPAGLISLLLLMAGLAAFQMRTLTRGES
jgi:hypothetical protein